MKTIAVLGSTGSIGTQALEVAKKHNLRVSALSANSNIKLVLEQIKEFSPEAVCISDEKKAKELKSIVGDTVEVLQGADGLEELAKKAKCDILLNSVVGIAGLKPTLSAIESGKDIALANKEALVCGGALVIDSARKKGVTIYPVDSEHSAIFQCLQGNSHNKISKIFLTASGGPFFGKTEKDLKEVTVAQALNHPNWSMGAKITVDSATLMNKGLELIEAMWLFGVDASQVEIVVHRESVLHSAVEYQDGSVIGQLGNPDMKIPIQYALLYPNRVDCDVKRLSFTDYGKLTFSTPDIKTFKCLGACIEAAKNTDTTMPVIANSANEEAVSLFLAGKIKFLQIGELVSKAVKNIPACKVLSLDDIITADKLAREFVKKEEVAI